MQISMTREVKQKRLNGLAMFSIDKYDSITSDEVLAELSNKKIRLEFLL